MISIETEERPCGLFYVLHDETTYKLKRIEIKLGGRLAYQYQNTRSEAFTIDKGSETKTLNSVLKSSSVSKTSYEK